MVTISSQTLQMWVVGLLWPLTRILGMVATAPIFGDMAIPKRIKLGLGLVLTLIIMPTLPPLPNFDVFSLQGLMILLQQLIIGLSIGFCMRLTFAAIGVAGQMIGMSMGLGFASFFDPQSHSQSTAITQFLNMLTMLIFLSLDGHLMLVSVVADSFTSMPIAVNGSGINPMTVVMWGESIFSAGLLLAMPAIAALLIANMALGILTRTAPQLNIFGIGFPLTLSIGFLVLAVALPGMLNPIERLIEQGETHMRQIVTPVLANRP